MKTHNGIELVEPDSETTFTGRDTKLDWKPNEPMNCCIHYKPTWREKLAFKLFPTKYVEPPPITYPWIGKGDCLVMRTVIYMSFLDRVRFLISGKLRVESKTITENRIGENVTFSESYVEAPTWLVGKPKEIENAKTDSSAS